MNSQDKHLIDELVAQGRVLLQGRLLSAGPLDESAISDVRRTFERWINRHAIFPEQVGREIDCPVSDIAQWRQGSFQGDADGLTRRLNDWLEVDARRRQATVRLDYIPTRAAEASSWRHAAWTPWRLSALPQG